MGLKNLIRGYLKPKKLLKKVHVNAPLGDVHMDLGDVHMEFLRTVLRTQINSKKVLKKVIKNSM